MGLPDLKRGRVGGRVIPKKGRSKEPPFFCFSQSNKIRRGAWVLGMGWHGACSGPFCRGYIRLIPIGDTHFLDRVSTQASLLFCSFLGLGNLGEYVHRLVVSTSVKASCMCLVALDRWVVRKCGGMLVKSCLEESR